jgi:cation diffusion facilitator CzcD-associated flavoprotein CzcO
MVQIAKVNSMEMTGNKSGMRNIGDDASVYDVVIVGAGFSGIYQLHKLRRLGFSVRVLDGADDLGGTWHWNCYPGARVDTQVPIYGYSDESLWRDWNWTERYPGWEELRSYFEFVDKKWDLKKDIQFKSWVTAARFDENEIRWTLTISNQSSVKARFVILATGSSSPPYIPKIEGAETFVGPKHHTALWPREGLSLEGKRVAVIGTGASGVQVVQEAAKVARHLTVFQRTPNMALPMSQLKLDPAMQTQMKKDYPARFARRRETFTGNDFDFLPQAAQDVSPEERRRVWSELWGKGNFSFWLENYNDVLSNEEINLEVYAFWRNKVLARIKDPEVAEILAPTVPVHPFGVKRCSLENGYFEVFNQDNVTLVDMRKTPIERVGPHSIVTTAGEHDVDVIVFATGFDAVSGAITHMNITGVGGVTINDYWKDGLRTQLGLSSAGFPNLFFLYGPQSPTAFWNGPSSAEHQGDVLVELLTHVRDNGYKRCESTTEADLAWAQLIDDIVQASLVPKADSWYMGANIPGKKRESLNFTGGAPLYLQKCKESADSGYSGFTLS